MALLSRSGLLGVTQENIFACRLFMNEKFQTCVLVVFLGRLLSTCLFSCCNHRRYMAYILTIRRKTVHVVITRNQIRRFRRTVISLLQRYHVLSNCNHCMPNM